MSKEHDINNNNNKLTIRLRKRELYKPLNENDVYALSELEVIKTRNAITTLRQFLKLNKNIKYLFFYNNIMIKSTETFLDINIQNGDLIETSSNPLLCTMIYYHLSIPATTKAQIKYRVPLTQCLTQLVYRELPYLGDNLELIKQYLPRCNIYMIENQFKEFRLYDMDAPDPIGHFSQRIYRKSSENDKSVASNSNDIELPPTPPQLSDTESEGEEEEEDSQKTEKNDDEEQEDDYNSQPTQPDPLSGDYLDYKGSLQFDANENKKVFIVGKSRLIDDNFDDEMDKNGKDDKDKATFNEDLEATQPDLEATQPDIDSPESLNSNINQEEDEDIPPTQPQEEDEDEDIELTPRDTDTENDPLDKDEDNEQTPPLQLKSNILVKKELTTKRNHSFKLKDEELAINNITIHKKSKITNNNNNDNDNNNNNSSQMKCNNIVNQEIKDIVTQQSIQNMINKATFRKFDILMRDGRIFQSDNKQLYDRLKQIESENLRWIKLFPPNTVPFLPRVTFSSPP